MQALRSHLRGAAAGFGIGVIDGVEVAAGGARHRRHHRLDDACDVEQADAPGDEGFERHLLGRVEHGARQAAFLDGLIGSKLRFWPSCGTLQERIDHHGFRA